MATLSETNLNRLTFAAGYMADLAYDIIENEYKGKIDNLAVCKLNYGVMAIERLKCPINFTNTEVEDLLEKLDELYVGKHNNKTLDILDDTVQDI